MTRWAARAAPQYAVERWAALAALPARKRVDLVKATPWRTSGDAVDHGDRVHDVFERIAKGEPVTDGEREDPKVRSPPQAFLDD